MDDSAEMIDLKIFHLPIMIVLLFCKKKTGSVVKNSKNSTKLHKFSFKMGNTAKGG